MSHLSPITTMPAHPEDPVMSGVTSIAKTSTPAAPSIPQPTRASSSVALSFAFDAIAKTLNVVVRDERSGDVVRTIEYKHIPTNLHSNDKLHGLLLNQFA